MGKYSIKDLEKISGIKAHTIRMWERRYQLIEPQRTSTNIRFYSDCDLRRLLNVAILNHNGIKISHIANFSEQEITKRVLDLSIDGLTNNVQIENMMVSLLELDEIKFLNTLSKSITRIGFATTVETIVFPFLERIGLLWQSGTINPAQEHFISNLIIQKLYAAIDKEMQTGVRKRLRVVFFLPEFEHHEILLLFYNLIARKEGFQVVYLGSGVPFHDLKLVHRLRPADIFVTSFISAIDKQALENTLIDYSQMFQGIPFLISGSQVRQHNPNLPKGFLVIDSVKTFKETVNLINDLDGFI